MALHHSAGPHPEPKETCHILWYTDCGKWPLITPLDPILSPSKCVIFYGTTILENVPPPPSAGQPS